jgi:hypothetical protein
MTTTPLGERVAHRWLAPPLEWLTASPCSRGGLLANPKVKDGVISQILFVVLGIKFNEINN